jgi:hypothetical protein
MGEPRATVRTSKRISGAHLPQARPILRFVAAMIVLAAPVSAASWASSPCCPFYSYVAGKLIVGFQSGVTRERVEEIAAQIGTLILHQFILSNAYVMGVPMGDEIAYITRFGAFPEVYAASPDYVGCIPELPACDCCPCGVICPDLPACSDPCSGAVPDGHRAPGQPLGIRSQADGTITLSWGASCGPSDADYEIYEGRIGNFRSHAPRSCSTGGTFAVTLESAVGNAYYLVVPRNAGFEGSYGTGSNRVERPLGAGACLPKQTNGCSLACSHDLCREGAPLVPACDACVSAICGADSFCCTVGWDAGCVAQVSSVCGDATCARTQCQAAGGVWADCGPISADCGCPGVVCAAVCVPECLCTGPEACPPGMQCVTPSCASGDPGICQ